MYSINGVAQKFPTKYVGDFNSIDSSYTKEGLLYEISYYDSVLVNDKKLKLAVRHEIFNAKGTVILEEGLFTNSIEFTYLIYRDSLGVIEREIYGFNSNGISFYYHPNGLLKEIQEFYIKRSKSTYIKKEIPHGYFYYFNSEGNLISVVRYRKGRCRVMFGNPPTR
jgi:antitoxin component YwqK of YwqJK toxin-antitoxin module